jgi:hypothetical protein
MLSHPGLGNRVAFRICVLSALLCTLLFAFGCQFGGGGHGGGGGGGNGGSGGGPAYTATITHQGNFTQGQQNATYTITLTNIGGNFVSNNGNLFSAFIAEELPSGLTLLSMAGTGWTCNIVPTPPSTLPGCNTNNPIAAGASAPTITVTVNVAPNASSPQINQVAYPGPSCPTCPTVSDSTTILPANGGPAVVGTTVPFPIFAGGGPTPIAISVTNDAPGDVLTASLTVDSNTGFACPTAPLLTCGSLGAVTGTSGSGSYSVLYTPPSSLTLQIVPTIVVSSNLSSSIGATDFIEVDPAGILVTTDDNNGLNEASGLNSSGATVQIGSAAKTVIVKVYNDTTGAGVTFPPLTGRGYACANIGTNSCGTLGVPSAPVLSGTTSTTTITYTPPASLPSAPYDRPRIQAVSKADATRSGSIVFVLNSNPVTNLTIRYETKFNSVLTGAAPTTQTGIARLVNDTGSSKSVNWTLTANGSNCSPACGTLGTAKTTVGASGTTVRSAITYTPPSSVPAGTGQAQPTITATSADDPAQNDSFGFTITDGTCSSANNGVLKGQYAFLLRGGAAPAGYVAFIGSFTADGAGKITGGLIDLNGSFGSFLGSTVGSTILPTGTSTPPFDSAYSVGADNRGCLTLADSSGGLETYRFSVGTLDASNVATEGRVIRFDDSTWRGRAQSGVLLKQDPTSFNAGALNGNYAFGEVGVDFNGGRFASAGLVTSNGVSTLSNISADYNDAGTAGSVTSGSGSYSISTPTGASSGRGTATTTTTITAPSGTVTANFVLYMVSSSEALIMSTDLQSTGEPIDSGELKKQTGPFSTAALNGNGYVFYTSGVNPGNGGGNVTAVGQATFTSTTGNATVTIDENNNGTSKPEQTGSATFTVDPNTGRMTVTGLGTTPPIIYLIDSNSGFSVGTDNGVPFGFVEKQTGGPFSNSSFSGPFFFGGDAPTTAHSYDSGTGSFDGFGGITANDDGSGPNGLRKDVILPSTGGTYSFSATSVPQGQGSISTEQRAYAISPSKLVMMRWVNSTVLKDPELFVIQK